jgi:Ca-activated chloride channel family protein
MNIQFGQPLLLLLIVTVPLLAATLVWGIWCQRRSAARFAGVGLGLLQRGGASQSYRLVRITLLVVVSALLVVAIARPEVGSHQVLLPREGSDVVIALDVSGSMGVNDVSPSRLEKAKQAAVALIDHLGGDRVGVVVFAGSASLRFPLTTDFQSAEQIINGIAIKDSGVAAGTDLGAALNTARDALTGDKTNGRVIVLITDGEDLSGSGLAAAQATAKSGVTIDTVGVGTASGGPVFAVNPETNAATPIIDPTTGKQAISHRDDAHLHQLASAGHGTAYDGNTTDFAFNLSTAIDSLQKTQFASGNATIPIERFQIPLGFALALLVLESLFADGRERLRRRRPATGDARPATELTTPESGSARRRIG